MRRDNTNLADTYRQAADRRVKTVAAMLVAHGEGITAQAPMTKFHDAVQTEVAKVQALKATQPISLLPSFNYKKMIEQARKATPGQIESKEEKDDPKAGARTQERAFYSSLRDQCIEFKKTINKMQSIPESQREEALAMLARAEKLALAEGAAPLEPRPLTQERSKAIDKAVEEHYAAYVALQKRAQSLQDALVSRNTAQLAQAVTEMSTPVEDKTLTLTIALRRASLTLKQELRVPHLDEDGHFREDRSCLNSKNTSAVNYAQLCQMNGQDPLREATEIKPTQLVDSYRETLQEAKRDADSEFQVEAKGDTVFTQRTKEVDEAKAALIQAQKDLAKKQGESPQDLDQIKKANEAVVTAKGTLETCESKQDQAATENPGLALHHLRRFDEASEAYSKAAEKHAKAYLEAERACAPYAGAGSALDSKDQDRLTKALEAAEQELTEARKKLENAAKNALALTQMEKSNATNPLRSLFENDPNATNALMQGLREKPVESLKDALEKRADQSHQMTSSYKTNERELEQYAKIFRMQGPAGTALLLLFNLLHRMLTEKPGFLDTCVSGTRTTLKNHLEALNAFCSERGLDTYSISYQNDRGAFKPSAPEAALKAGGFSNHDDFVRQFQEFEREYLKNHRKDDNATITAKPGITTPTGTSTGVAATTRDTRVAGTGGANSAPPAAPPARTI